MPITLKPIIPPDWVQQLRSSGGDFPLVALDFKNDRYYVEGYGEVSLSDVVMYDPTWGNFHERHVVPNYGLTGEAQAGDGVNDGGSPRLTDLCYSALNTTYGRFTRHSWGNFTVVTETNFGNSSGASLEVRNYMSSSPTDYVAMRHNSALAGQNQIIAYTATQQLTGNPSTISASWQGDPQPGKSTMAATLNSFRMRGCSRGGDVYQIHPDFPNSFTRDRLGIISPSDGALERLCIYRQQTDNDINILSHPKRVMEGLPLFDTFRYLGGFTSDFGGAPDTYGTLTVPFGRSLEVGDLMILWVQTPNFPIPAPAGWTEIVQDGKGTFVNTTIVGHRALRFAAFWKRVESTGESPPTITLASQAQSEIIATITFYKGVVQTGNPIDSFAIKMSPNNSRTLTWPTLTPSSPNCRILFAAASDINGEKPNSIIPPPPINGLHVETAVQFSETILFSSSVSPLYKGGHISVFGMDSRQGVPPVSSRLFWVMGWIAMTIALIPEDIALPALTLENVPAKKNEWRSAEIGNRTAQSVLSLVSGTSGNFETYVMDSPPRLFYRPSSGFVGTTQNVTIRETYGTASNSPRDTTFAIPIEATAAVPTVPAINRRRYARHWYSGGDAVFQIRIVPTNWQEEWCDPAVFAPQFLFPFLTFIDELPDSDVEQRLALRTEQYHQPNLSFFGNEWGRSAGNKRYGGKFLFSPEDNLSTVLGSVYSVANDKFNINFYFVNRKTGECILSFDHCPINISTQNVSINPRGLNVGLQAVYYRRAQRDPGNLQPTGSEEWIEMELSNLGSSQPNRTFYIENIDGTAHLQNPLKHHHRRFPLKIKIPVPDPLPTNFTLSFEGEIRVLDVRNMTIETIEFVSDYFSVTPTILVSNDPAYPSKLTAEYIQNNRIFSGITAPLAKLAATVEPGLVTVTVDCPFPYVIDTPPAFTEYAYFVHERNGSDVGIGTLRMVMRPINVAGALTVGSRQPWIGDGDNTTSTPQGVGALSFFETPNPLQPTQHPSIVVNDIICVIVLSKNEIVNAPSGYRLAVSEGFGVGGANSSGSLRASLFWKRATVNAENIPTFGGIFAGQAMCRSFIVTGAATEGNPFISIAVNKSETATTLVEYAGIYIPRDEYVGLVGIGCYGRSGNRATGNVILKGKEGRVDESQGLMRVSGTSPDGSGGGISLWDFGDLQGGYWGHYTDFFNPEETHEDGFREHYHTIASASEYISIVCQFQRAIPTAQPRAPYIELSNPDEGHPPISYRYLTSTFPTNMASFLLPYVISPTALASADVPEPFGSLTAIISNDQATDFYNQGGTLATVGMMNAEGTYTPPFSPPSVLAHSLDFTSQAYTLTGSSYTIDTILKDYNTAEITSAGMQILGGELLTPIHQPEAIGDLYSILSTLNFSIVIEWDQGPDNSFGYLMEWLMADENNAVEFYYNNGNLYTAWWYGDYNLVGQVVANARNKLAVSFNSTGIRSSLNGGTAVSDTTPPNLVWDLIHIGCSFYGGSDLSGTIRSISLYNNERSSADIRQLSSLV